MTTQTGTTTRKALPYLLGAGANVDVMGVGLLRDVNSLGLQPSEYRKVTIGMVLGLVLVFTSLILATIALNTHRTALGEVLLGVGFLFWIGPFILAQVLMRRSRR